MTFALVLQILQVGFVGLAFLLAYLAYRLLHTQSAKDKPSKQVLDSTSRYMVFALAMAAVAVAGQLLQSVIPANVPSDIEGRLTSLEQQASSSNVEERLAHMESRLNGVRLVARDAGVANSYGCGTSHAVEATSLTVMYGLRDGTSCGVPNTNYYKRLTLEVPR